MGQSVGFANCFEVRRVDAAEDHDHVDVRGRPQASLRRRAKQHNGLQIAGERLSQRRGKFGQRRLVRRRSRRVGRRWPG
jgi:hypothetical protein